MDERTQHLLNDAIEEFDGELDDYIDEWTSSLEKQFGGDVKESAESDHADAAQEWIAAVLAAAGTDVQESKDASGHDHAADGKFGTGGATADSSGVLGKAAEFAGKAPAAIVSAFKAVAAKVQAVATNKFTQFEARYGRNGAVAIMAAVVATLPLPGSGLATLAVAESVRFVVGKLA